MDADTGEDEFLRARPVTEVPSAGPQFELRSSPSRPEPSQISPMSIPPQRHSPQSPPPPLQTDPFQRPNSVPVSTHREQIGTCSHCQLQMKYPTGSSHIRCPRCTQVTAMNQYCKMMCPYCRAVMMFPQGARLVRCACGKTFATVPGVYHIVPRT